MPPVGVVDSGSGGGTPGDGGTSDAGSQDAGQGQDAGDAHDGGDSLDAGSDAGLDAGAETLPDPWTAELVDSTAPLPRSPWTTNSSLLVPLATVNRVVVLRAIDHLVTFAAGASGTNALASAALESSALPLYRPDVTGPAYYELKLTRDGGSAGYLIVSTGVHDAPVVELREDGPTPSERLFEAAGAATIARIVRLDGEHQVAEDATGNAVVASRPWVLIGRSSAAGGPPQLETSETLSDWASGKTAWIAASSDGRRHLNDAFAPLWTNDAQRDTVRNGSIDPLLLASVPRVQLSSWIETSLTPTGETSECQFDFAVSPVSTPVNNLTPLWNQQSNFQHATQPLGTKCASGCGATAYAIVLGWMDRMASVPNGSAWALPQYRRATFRHRSPGPLLATYAQRAYDESASLPWGWVGDSVIEPGPATSAAMDMRRFLTEISTDIGTFCRGNSGTTTWGAMGQFQTFLGRHRLNVQFHNGNNPFGEPGFRDDVIDSLRTTGAPGVINIYGIDGHYVVVNGHQRCRNKNRTNGQVTADFGPWLYLNMGWSGSQNHWEPIGNLMMSATFRPVPAVMLQATHSAKLVGRGSGDRLWQLGITSPTPLDTLLHGYREHPLPDGSLVLENLGQCLTADGSYEGATISHQPCAIWASQHWRFISNGADNFFQVKSMSANRCLEVTGGSFQEAPMRLATCSGAASQKLDLLP